MISFNPQLTTAPANSFLPQTEGYVQGSFYSDDPAIRLSLPSGQLASTVIGPVWGGMALTENVPPPNNNQGGNSLVLATSVANTTAFSVFNQANNMIIVPGNSVPLAVAGMSMNYFRTGSNATIAVQCDNGLAASLDSGAINQNVSWDFKNSVLQPYDAATPTVSVTSITSSYSSVTGLYTLAVVAAAPSLVGAVGDLINISGVTGTGAALVNGDQAVTAYTDNEHFSFQIAAASGSIATGALTGTIVLNEGTVALPVKVLFVNTNSKIVTYNNTTGALTWTVGAAAIIQI